MSPSFQATSSSILLPLENLKKISLQSLQPIFVQTCAHALQTMAGWIPSLSLNPMREFTPILALVQDWCSRGTSLSQLTLGNILMPQLTAGTHLSMWTSLLEPRPSTTSGTATRTWTTLSLSSFQRTPTIRERYHRLQMALKLSQESSKLNSTAMVFATQACSSISLNFRPVLLFRIASLAFKSSSRVSLFPSVSCSSYQPSSLSSHILPHIPSVLAVSAAKPRKRLLEIKAIQTS